MAINTDLQNRVDAYRGNPGALQQKYAMNPQLLDLLALQKIKSEKEAAARDLQLKMAQQQAAQGQPPTTRDKIEQEVVGMTKQELAQQVGGLAQQRQQDQQKKMQRLLQSGVATLPAPGLARMAGGGIVAFAGEDGSFVEEDMTEEEKEKLRRLTRRGVRGPREEEEEVERVLTRRGLRPSPRISPEPPEPAPDDRALLNLADAELRSQPAPAPIAPPAPAPAPGGLATLPGAKPSAPAPAVPPPATPMAGAGLPSAMTDPFAKGQAVETRVAGLLGLSPAQRRTYEQGVEDLRRLYAEETDPKARRERELSAFLRGAGGRSSFGSVMAGGSGAAETERRRSFGQRLKGTEAVQKGLENIIGIERGAVKEGIGAGQEAAKVGATMRGFEMRSKDVDKQLESAGLDRESRERIAGINAEVQKEIAKANRELQGEIRTQTQLRLLTDGRQRAINTATKNINTQIAQLESLQTMGGKLDKAQQEQLANLRSRRDLIVSGIEDQYDDLIDALAPGGGLKVVGVKPGSAESDTGF